MSERGPEALVFTDDEHATVEYCWDVEAVFSSATVSPEESDDAGEFEAPPSAFEEGEDEDEDEDLLLNCVGCSPVRYRREMFDGRMEK